MPDDPTPESKPSDGGTSGTTPPAPPEFTPITSQDDLNKVIAARIERERAKFADYADLKAKAGRLDEIEEANKTEAQKLADAKAAAEKERDDALRDALRLRVATRHGISDEDADLFLTGTDEETLTKQAERLAARNEEAGKPRPPKPDPNQGRTPTGKPSTADQFAAAIGGVLNR